MGKPSAPVVGYHYRLAAHFIITPRKINGFLEFRGGTKTAWSGSVTESSTVQVDAPNLWGGEKDQGGIVTPMDFMFGDDDQLPNPYLVSVFGAQVCAWRGWTGVSLDGGRYGAMNPYAQKPSWKFWRTTAGWDDDACWYEAKAEVPLVDDFSLPADAMGWDYQIGSAEASPGYNNLEAPPSGWFVGQAPFAGGDLISSGNTEWPDHNVLWIKRTVVIPAGAAQHRLRVIAENGCVVFVNGLLVGAVNRDNVQIVSNQANTFEFPLNSGESYDIIVKAFDETDPGGGTFLSIEVLADGLIAANPAHVLYETLTAQDMGREPVESVNDDSFRAAADKLYAEGFGICPSWDTGSESLDDFRERIEKLIAGSLNLSLEDGQWYLDLARGDYVLDDLPILTDDDLLDFKELPATLDNAINSVSVKWLDPQTKSRKTTAPVRSLGLVRQFGTNHQVYDYPEIATEALALRVAQRELMATTTPTRAYDCAWKPGKVYKLRPNQYFRLQAPKRGIADMVCIVGEKQHGTLKSGAIKMKAVQDIYGMPTTSFSQGEPGVDTRPPQTPNAITLQIAFEAPYVEVVGALTRADLAALPDDIGFAVSAASAPAGELDFAMMVDAGAGYDEAGRGEWAATATVNEAAAKGDTAFTLAAGKRLDQVVVGMGALWEDELVRVDAIDAGAGTITLGRGCADTVPVAHADNARLWFYDVGMANDTTEYTDGETVNIKLLSNTGSQQTDISVAAPMRVTFDRRQIRPYPPANVTINGEWYPSSIAAEEVTLAWVHRDRVLQADQLVDNAHAGIGPEAGTTYNVRYFLDGTPVSSETGIVGTAATPYTFAGGGDGRIELESERDGFTSWQMHVLEFTVDAPVVTNYIALPLTYDEVDASATMTWLRQGNGPQVTPTGFEGDGYEARLKSTTIPTWMQSASSLLTMHASISFYPQKVKSSSEFVVYAGEDDSTPFAKMGFSVVADATNSGIAQLTFRGGTGGTSFVEKLFGRSGWKFQFRTPELTSGGYDASPQALVFLDADTVLLSVHFEDHFSRVYKISIADAQLLGQFDCSGDFAHIAVLAFRSNGDLWALASSNKACRIDLAASLASGSLVTLDLMGFSGLTVGALEFVTVSGTEYAVIPEYLTSGTPYIYVFTASSFGPTTLAASSRYKRFTGCSIETQGCVMRSGKLLTSSIAKPGAGTGSRFGFIGRFDIVTAIGSTSDGGAISSELNMDSPSKYGEDCAVHPTTNDLWVPTEGIASVGSDAGGLSVWSSALDGAVVENHYTAAYDGAGTTTLKVNNRPYDTLSGTLAIDVDCVTIGGPPATAAGIANRYFTGYVRNVILQDQPLTNSQYAAAVNGDHEPNSLTAYEFTLTNPGAESGSATGWTAESGGINVWPAATVAPHSGGYCFYGGASATSINRQRLDVLAQTGLTGTQVDAGGIWAKVRWWQSNFDSAADSGAMGLRTLNSTPTQIAEAYAGLAITPNSTTAVDGHVWYPRAFSAALASGTRYVDALIKSVRSSGTNNDSYFDDVQVTVYRQ